MKIYTWVSILYYKYIIDSRYLPRLHNNRLLKITNTTKISKGSKNKHTEYLIRVEK